MDSLARTSLLVAIAAVLSIGEVGSGQTPIPLMDMKPTETYQGFSGGLYPNGSNVAPLAHDAAGVARATVVTPLDRSGVPSPSGRIVLLSVGLSNTSLEFCGRGDLGIRCDPWSFTAKALADPTVNHSTLVLVNGAAGGEGVTEWDSPADPNYERVKVESLDPQGLTEAQVQVVLLKDFDSVDPTVPVLPSVGANAVALETEYGKILRALRIRYPNLRQCFLSSRIYGGFADYPFSANPEPWAYETGFAVKWVIEDQINQMSGRNPDEQGGDLDYGDPAGPDFGVAPWIGWAAYLWADTTPRSDGLVFRPEDFVETGFDRQHPSPSGAGKVADLWKGFFKTSPYTTPWFLSSAPNECTVDCLRTVEIVLSPKAKGTANMIGRIIVENESGIPVAGATVDASWIVPNGGPQSQSAVTDSTGAAIFSADGERGAYTLTVTDVEKLGFTFDRSHSVLTKSIAPRSKEN